MPPMTKDATTVVTTAKWSRAWLERQIPQVYCLKCMRKEAKEAEEQR